MKLLFDQNLSYLLASDLEKWFPGSSHVRLEGLSTATDKEVWDFAQKHNFVIVTQDSDFNDFSVYYGHPPKVIWVRSGNVGTPYISRLFQKNLSTLQSFYENPLLACLEFY